MLPNDGTAHRTCSNMTPPRLLWWKALIPLLLQLFVHLLNAAEMVRDLKQVHIIYRHGDRAPLRDFDGSGYNPYDWPEGLSQITGKGLAEQFELGEFFRARYSAFLRPGRENREVYIRSTDHDRTMQSALANAAGMFPPVNGTWWDRDHHDHLMALWRPVSIHTVPVNLEFVLKQTAVCPKLQRLNKELHDQRELVLLAKEYKNVEDLLTKKFLEAMTSKEELNKKTEFWDRITVVDDIIKCLSSHSLRLPSWLQDDTLKSAISLLSDWQFFFWVGGYSDNQRARLVGGPLLHEIVGKMLNSTKPGPKMYIYSGHDSTVAGLLSVFGMYNVSLGRPPKIPAYNAAVLVELFTNDTVRISFLNELHGESHSVVMDPVVLQHPKCQLDFCPLANFTMGLAGVLVADWVEECDDRNFIIRAIAEHAPASGAWATVVVLGIVLLLLFAFRWWRDRKRRFNRPVASQSLSDPILSYRTLENLNT